MSNTLQKIDGVGQFYSLKALNDPRVATLPYSIRVLLECALRNCDEFEVTKKDVENILNWQTTSKQDTEIPFKPARVIMQDFTGVPAVVDLAAMRDAIKRLGGDPKKINPQVPSDLVIDHSVQVDVAGSADALEANERIEFERNGERFGFLKWGAQAFENMLIVPPGSGIVHQVNLEYLARVVFAKKDNNSTDLPMLYPDSVVGTDSHTTMIDGLGVVGWGVGGIEAEAVMLGQPISMVLPEVVGFKLTGRMHPLCTATDVVLTCTQMLRRRGVVGKFVEFFGPGVESLGLADRATIANMSPEYGATMGFFPVDQETLRYLRQTGRDEATLERVEKYLTAQGLFRTYGDKSDDEKIVYSGDVLELDLSTVVPCVSGPKRPHDRVTVKDLKNDFLTGLTAPVSFKGFGLTEEQKKTSSAEFVSKRDGKTYKLHQGSVVISAITSCTNTSNPSVMLAAGMIAQNALKKGIKVAPYIKTSLSPGSGVALEYLKKAGLLEALEAQGFFVAGFGCMTCIGNSGDLDEEVTKAITDAGNDLVVSAVLSGNRNFEGRVHPLTRANYLASPPLCVAYALAGRVDIDFDTEPIALNDKNEPVFLKDIWPTLQDVAQVEAAVVQPAMFKEVYGKIARGEGNKRWAALQVTPSSTYHWDDKSTYIHNPPFFQTTQLEAPKTFNPVKSAHVLLNLGDSITTDHISPAGNIAKTSPAARYLIERGVQPRDFNSYGARRGNDEIMARGTFANVRIVNKLLSAIALADGSVSPAGRVGPRTVHIPSRTELDIFDAAMLYKNAQVPTIILAGQEYGSGSSRDWAAKGPYLQGVKAVIAQSYERIHRSNLVGMGVLPLQFKAGQSADALGLDGSEVFDIPVTEEAILAKSIKVTARKTDGSVVEFEAVVRLDTAVEVEYFRNGGILHYVLRRLANGN